MDRLHLVSYTGGFLAILTLIHFAVDWIFQTHNEAMTKHNNWQVRANHCAIYTFPFIMFLSWCEVPALVVCSSAFILFTSHFMEDTYIPVFLWAKYIRKPLELQTSIQYTQKPEQISITYMGKDCHLIIGDMYYMIDNHPGVSKDGIPWTEEDIFYKFQSGILTLEQANNKLAEEGFKRFIDTNIGKILMIAIDQIIHIAFLIPIAIMLALR